MIVFYGDCEFKTSLSLPENTFLIYAKDLQETIKKIVTNKPEVIYPDKQHIISVLNDSVKNGQDLTIVDRHIRNINRFFD